MRLFRKKQEGEKLVVVVVVVDVVVSGGVVVIVIFETLSVVASNEKWKKITEFFSELVPPHDVQISCNGTTSLSIWTHRPCFESVLCWASWVIVLVYQRTPLQPENRRSVGTPPDGKRGVSRIHMPVINADCSGRTHRHTFVRRVPSSRINFRRQKLADAGTGASGQSACVHGVRVDMSEIIISAL